MENQWALPLALFVSSSAAWLLRAKINLMKRRNTARDIVSLMEERVQRDEGGRGISEILPQRGELYNAALELLSPSVRKVAILTGFPCMIQHVPPTETDGPLGALAIARACLHCGKDVVLLTDECNEEVLIAAAAASGLHKEYGGFRFKLESFPGGINFDTSDEERLRLIGSCIDLVIAIERTGPCHDGSYRTMRALDMTNMVAPLEEIIMYGRFNKEDGSGNGKIRSIGIGDGGNEVGMGKIYDAICNSSIPNAKNIACIVSTDHLIVCSVSNWGGYALGAAVALLYMVKCDSLDIDDAIKCLPNASKERTICERMIQAGARDGVTGKQELMVDGMPLSTSLQVLEDCKAILEKSQNLVL